MGLYTGKAYFQNIYDRHAVSYSNPKTCTLNHQHQYENADNAIISVLATWGVKRHHFRFRSTWSMVPFPVHVVNGSVSGPRGQWFRFRPTWLLVPFPVHVASGHYSSAVISVSGPSVPRLRCRWLLALAHGQAIAGNRTQCVLGVHLPVW